MREGPAAGIGDNARMLTMAAPAQTGPERGPLLVLLAGVVTSALTLLGVWWLDVHTKDVHIMGW